MQPRFPFDDLVLFTQHVGAAVKMGLPLHQAVRLLSAEMSNGRVRRSLAGAAEDLERGATLHQALSSRKRVFPDYYLNVLRSGEKAGALPETLAHLADILQHNFILSQKMKKAFAYPVLVLGVLGMFAIVLTGWIGPNMEGVLDELRDSSDYLTGELSLEQPALLGPFAPHVATVTISVIAAVVVLFFFVGRFVRAGWCGLIFDRFDLYFPVLGVFTRYAIASRLTRSLASILRCGIPLPEALGLCAEMIENGVVKKSILNMRASVEKGGSLSASMKSISIFPPSLVWMLSAGEVRGDFLHTLDQLADFYQATVETTSAWMVEVIEPILILLVGLVFIVLAATIFSPMLTLFGASFSEVNPF